VAREVFSGNWNIMSGVISTELQIINGLKRENSGLGHGHNGLNKAGDSNISEADRGT
jgi:hypothetical protein